MQPSPPVQADDDYAYRAALRAANVDVANVRPRAPKLTTGAAILRLMRELRSLGAIYRNRAALLLY